MAACTWFTKEKPRVESTPERDVDFAGLVQEGRELLVRLSRSGSKGVPSKMREASSALKDLLTRKNILDLARNSYNHPEVQGHALLLQPDYVLYHKGLLGQVKEAVERLGLSKERARFQSLFGQGGAAPKVATLHYGKVKFSFPVTGPEDPVLRVLAAKAIKRKALVAFHQAFHADCEDFAKSVSGKSSERNAIVAFLKQKVDGLFSDEGRPGIATERLIKFLGKLEHNNGMLTHEEKERKREARVELRDEIETCHQQIQELRRRLDELRTRL